MLHVSHTEGVRWLHIQREVSPSRRAVRCSRTVARVPPRTPWRPRRRALRRARLRALLSSWPRGCTRPPRRGARSGCFWTFLLTISIDAPKNSRHHNGRSRQTMERTAQWRALPSSVAGHMLALVATKMCIRSLSGSRIWRGSCTRRPRPTTALPPAGHTLAPVTSRPILPHTCHPSQPRAIRALRIPL